MSCLVGGALSVAEGLSSCKATLNSPPSPTHASPLHAHGGPFEKPVSTVFVLSALFSPRSASYARPLACLPGLNQPFCSASAAQAASHFPCSHPQSNRSVARTYDLPIQAYPTLSSAVIPPETPALLRQPTLRPPPVQHAQRQFPPER